MASLNSEGIQEQLEDDGMSREKCHDFDDKELSIGNSDDAEPEVIDKAISPELVASLAQSIGSSEARSSDDVRPRIRLSLVRNNLQRVKDQLERTAAPEASPRSSPSHDTNEVESPPAPLEDSVSSAIPEGDYLSPTRLRRHTIASYSPGFPSPPVIQTPLTHRSVEADASQVELQEAPPNRSSTIAPRTSDVSREGSISRESTTTTRTAATSVTASQAQVQALQAALAEMLPPGSMQAQTGHGLHLQDLLSPRVSDILSPILSPRDQSQVQSMCCWIWSGISAPLVPVFDALGVATRSCYSRDMNRSLLDQECIGTPQEMHLNRENSTILSRRQAQAETTSVSNVGEELEKAPVPPREESRLPTGPAEIVD